MPRWPARPLRRSPCTLLAASLGCASWRRAAAPLAAEEQTVTSTKWVCSVCGYVYEGETVPEDYKCPICGVGPDKFVKEE